MRRADPLAVAEAQLTGALFRLANVGPTDTDAVEAVDDAEAKVLKHGGDPARTRYKVDHVLTERVAMVRGHQYSKLARAKTFT